MPVISRFYGIVILMYFNEHNPPHFHAKYEGQLAVFNIKTGRIVAGKLPPKAKVLIKEWMKLHKEELLLDWQIAQNEGELKIIEPLL